MSNDGKGNYGTVVAIMYQSSSYLYMFEWRFPDRENGENSLTGKNHNNNSCTKENEKEYIDGVVIKKMCINQLITLALINRLINY